jgi:hypothetical protein
MLRRCADSRRPAAYTAFAGRDCHAHRGDEHRESGARDSAPQGCHPRVHWRELADPSPTGRRSVAGLAGGALGFGLAAAQRAAPSIPHRTSSRHRRLRWHAGLHLLSLSRSRRAIFTSSCRRFAAACSTGESLAEDGVSPAPEAPADGRARAPPIVTDRLLSRACCCWPCCSAGALEHARGSRLRALPVMSARRRYPPRYTPTRRSELGHRRSSRPMPESWLTTTELPLTPEDPRAPSPCHRATPLEQHSISLCLAS